MTLQFQYVERLWLRTAQTNLEVQLGMGIKNRLRKCQTYQARMPYHFLFNQFRHFFWQLHVLDVKLVHLCCWKAAQKGVLTEMKNRFEVWHKRKLACLLLSLNNHSYRHINPPAMFLSKEQHWCCCVEPSRRHQNYFLFIYFFTLKWCILTRNITGGLACWQIFLLTNSVQSILDDRDTCERSYHK